jgi:hypothetical protein
MPKRILVQLMNRDRARLCDLGARVRQFRYVNPLLVFRERRRCSIPIGRSSRGLPSSPQEIRSDSYCYHARQYADNNARDGPRA